MSQIDNHLKWCLKDPNRLVKIRPDKKLAQDHLKKSEYDTEVMMDLEELKRYDWALNVGFYALYHCFLAILAIQGYKSKNQSCSVCYNCFSIHGIIIFYSKSVCIQVSIWGIMG